MFTKIEEKETHINSFYKTSITPAQSREGNCCKKIKLRNKSIMNTDANWIKQHMKSIIYHEQVRFIPEMQE